MVATIVLACGAWLLVRTEGINGDHVATFEWRWLATAEEELLSHADLKPGNVPARDPVEALAEWPGFRGPERNGVISGVRLDTDWTASSPLELWRRPVGPGWSSFAVDGDLLFTQEQRGDDEVVSCYVASTGKPVWVHADPVRFFESNAGAGPRATPTLHDGHVYTLDATGILNALDARDGRVLWSHDVAQETAVNTPPWGFVSSPLVIDDVVIVHAGALLAYQLDTGARRWQGPPTGGTFGTYSSPHRAIVDGIDQVLMLAGDSLTGLDPENGTLFWQHAMDGAYLVQPALTASGDLLVGTPELGVRRIAIRHETSGWSTAERWTSTGLKPYFNDFVVHEGHAYGFDGRILAAIDLEDGTQKWKGGRYGSGQLVLLADQHLLLVISERGELALVRAQPDRFEELARFAAVEGKTWNHPVLVRDLLLVRNDREMAAFRLTLAAGSDT